MTLSPVGNDQIDLSWTDSSSNEDGFSVERDGVEIATLGPNVTDYSDPGLDCDTMYSYRVRAFNGGGNFGIFEYR